MLLIPCTNLQAQFTRPYPVKEKSLRSPLGQAQRTQEPLSIQCWHKDAVWMSRVKDLVLLLSGAAHFPAGILLLMNYLILSPKPSPYSAFRISPLL